MADVNSLEQLKTDLKQQMPRRLYIFHGEESYLRAFYLDRLHKLLVEDFAETFNYHRFTAETLTPPALRESVDALPMMSEHTMVQLDDVNLFALPEQDREEYAEILAQLPDYCTLVLVYETVEYHPDKRKKKLAHALEQGLEVAFTRPAERELVSWVARHFKSRQKRISVPMCQYLIRLTGGDMTTLLSEIGKVAAFSEGEEITQSDIDAVVEPVLEAAIFDLTDALAAGRGEQALRVLHTLLQLQQEPIMILAAIGSQMRRIYTAKRLRGTNPAGQLMELYGIKSYPANKSADFARRLSLPFCRHAVLRCLEADEQLKTSYDDPERVLELLVIELAQEARNA